MFLKRKYSLIILSGDRKTLSSTKIRRKFPSNGFEIFGPANALTQENKLKREQDNTKVAEHH